MLDDRLSWPISSAYEIGKQKICHAKISRFSLPIKSILLSNIENILVLMIKSANFLDIGHHGDCLQWEVNIYFCYFLVYFRSLDAQRIMQVSFCDLHSAVMYS